jgi:hypothetical protein
LAHLFALQVTLQGVEEESVMGNRVPVEDLLLFLGANAVVLVQEVEEWALGLFQRGVGARLEVAQVGEDSFFELFRVLDRPAKSLEAKRETADNVGAGNVKEVVPGEC